MLNSILYFLEEFSLLVAHKGSTHRLVHEERYGKVLDLQIDVELFAKRSDVLLHRNQLKLLCFLFLPLSIVSLDLLFEEYLDFGIARIKAAWMPFELLLDMHQLLVGLGHTVLNQRVYHLNAVQLRSRFHILN